MSTDAIEQSEGDPHVVEQKPEDNNYAWIGPMKRPHHSMNLWEFNSDTLVVSKAEILKVASGIKDMRGKDIMQNELVPKAKHIYNWALTKQGAYNKIMAHLTKYAQQMALEKAKKEAAQ